METSQARHSNKIINTTLFPFFSIISPKCYVWNGLLSPDKQNIYNKAYGEKENYFIIK